MTKHLLIIESINKAPLLNAILNNRANGDTFHILATFGHIENLPANHIGVEPKTYYPIVELKNYQIIQKINEISKDCKYIYLATDPDREGESIAYSIYRHISPDAQRKSVRIVFRSLYEILNAINSPTKIDINLVKAQMARRVLDRLIGFGLTYSVRKQLAGNYTVGRVQTPILKQIADATVKHDYNYTNRYDVHTVLDIYGSVGAASLYLQHTKSFDNLSQANAFYSTANGGPYKVSRITKTQQSIAPPQAFNTFSMVSSGYDYHGFSAHQSMDIAQKLYEKGIITYPRTENEEIDIKHYQNMTDYIREQYGQQYIEQMPSNILKKTIQLSHTGIVPVDIYRKTEISDEENKLYETIINRALASVMSPAVLNIYNITIENNKGLNETTKAADIVFDGWSKVLPDELDVPYQPLPYGIKENMRIQKGYSTIESTQDREQLLNDATIAKMMQEKGIGRPSTISSVISNIVNEKRNYVEKTPKGYRVTANGKRLVDFVEEKYPSIVDTDYTKKVETMLDKISKNEADYTDTIHQALVEIKKRDGIDLSPENIKNHYDKNIITSISDLSR